MKLKCPSLVLTYTEDNSTSTITDQYIVRNSIKISEQWIKDLKSSSNIVQLQLSSDCPDIIQKAGYVPSAPCILQSESDIKAVLRDYDAQTDTYTTVFTGYVSDSQQWTVTSSGEKALDIKLEDVGTRLLPKGYYPNSSRATKTVKLEGAADTVIRNICTACGVTVDSGLPVINTQVLKVFNAGTSCQSLLSELVLEVGYAYYFTNEGKLTLRKIDCTSTSGAAVLDSDDLYIYNGEGLILQKQIRQYKSSKVTYKTLADREQALVYKDISGQKPEDGYPDCDIKMVATTGQEYPKYYPDPEGNDSYVKAQDLTNGNEIVYIDNVVPEVEYEPAGTLTVSISQFGQDTISVLLTCNSTGGEDYVNVTKLQAYADIKYVAAENDIIAGIVSAGDESDNMMEKTCEWIHDKTAAENLSKLFVNYYKYCNRQYQFYTRTDMPCGTIVKVYDNEFSGLSNFVMIIGKDYSDGNSIVKYTAVSIKEFEVNIPTTKTTVYSSPSSVNVNTPPSNAFFDVNLSKGIYRRNIRKTSKQEISVTVSIAGYPDTNATVTVDNGSFSSSTDVTSVTVPPTATLYIPYDNNYDTIVVRGNLISDPTVEVRKVISAVNETATWLYLGALNALPVASTYNFDKFAPGDHFLCVSDIGTSQKAGNCYAWTGEEWLEASPSLTDTEGNILGEDFYATAITNCLDDAVDTNFNDGTQLGGWVKRLAANEIITDTLMAKELIMRSTGVLRSAQYAESEGFPTSGYKLTSADGTLKAMNAYLRDVNIKCTDSTNAILLQTQRYQAGASGIAVRNSNQPARWCIDDLASTLSVDSQTNCTYATNSRSVFKPTSTLYTYGYRYLISTASLTSGGRTSSGYANGDSIYEFPVNGYYYIYAPNIQNVTYPRIITSSGTIIGGNNSDLMYDMGYVTAGTKVMVYNVQSYKVYLYNTNWNIEISEKVSKSFDYNGGGWGGYTQGFVVSGFSGTNYIPEVWVEPGSALSQALTTNNFDSEQNRNMYALSSNIAGWAEGLYNCNTGSSVTEGSTTLTVVNIGITSNSVSFTDASFNSITVSLPISTSAVATTGWAKNLDGTINLIGQVSAILTMNVLPSRNNAATLGTAGQAWSNVVSYGYNSLSSRKEKKDIEPYTDSATDIINDTQVVSFHYKNDKDNLPKIGFIAEDTDPLMSTPKQDKFDLNNTVGLLLKAVQELSQRLDRLESR